MFALVGLGNPGAEYANTRHNAGFWVIDAWCERHKDALSGASWTDGGGCNYLKVKFKDEHVLLVKPIRYMNRSGEAALPTLRFFKVALEDTLLIYDELDLPAGVARLKRGGSSGGHRGVADFSRVAGSDEFLRLRIGIGHPRERLPAAAEGKKTDPNVTGWLLNPIKAEERREVDRAVSVAAEAIDWLISEGFQSAQQKLHSVSKQPPA